MGSKSQSKPDPEDQQTDGQRRLRVRAPFAQHVGRAKADRQYVRGGRPRYGSQHAGKSRGVYGIPGNLQRGKYVDELEHRVDPDGHGEQAREVVVGAPAHVPQQQGHDAADHDDAGVEEGVQEGASSAGATRMATAHTVKSATA